MGLPGGVVLGCVCVTSSPEQWSPQEHTYNMST